MADKVITYKIKVVNESGDVVEQTANNMKSLTESVSSLEKELETAEFGSDKFNQLTKALKDNKGALDQAKNSTMSLGEKFSSIPGPIGQVAQGVKGLGTAFKALIANPVGLVIAAIALALTTLYKAFTSTKAGAEKMERVMAAVSAAMDVLRDRVVKVGGAIVKFFSGDFSGAFADAKASVSGIGDEIVGEMNKAAAATKKLQEVEDRTRNLNVERAKQNALISEAKGKINDENLSYEERQKALEEVRKAEVSLAKQEQKLAEDRYKALKALADLSDSNKETLDELAQAEQDMYNKQKETADKQKEIADQQKALRDRQRAEAKARADEQKRLAKEAADFEKALNLNLVTDAYEKIQLQIENDKQAALETIKNLKVTEEKKAELRLKVEEDTNNKLLAEKQKHDEEILAKQQETQQKEYDLKTRSVDALISLDAMKYDKLDELTQEDIDNTLSLMKKKTDLLLENDELTNEERLLIQAQYDQASLKLTTDYTNAKIALGEKELQAERDQAKAAADALGLIAEAAGEQTILGQAAAVAQATISTYLAAQEAYAAVVGVPGIGPALAVAAAASAVSLGLKNIQKIMEVDTNIPKPSTPKYALGGLVGGQGSSSMDNINAMLSPGESVINARSTSMFRPLLSAINQMGGGNSFSGGIVSNGIDASQLEILNSIRGNNEKPVEAYVVSTDMTNRQMLDRQIKSRSLI